MARQDAKIHPINFADLGLLLQMAKKETDDETSNAKSNENGYILNNYMAGAITTA
jgi:hypothetical protein